jgi:esterase FrsA
MNDVSELKQFAAVHARGQKIRGYQKVLSRISTDDGNAPGSWVGEWSRTGEALLQRGCSLDACRHYNMARFPYVNDAARRRALHDCLGAFDLWRQAYPRIQRLDVDFMGCHLRCWTSGLSEIKRLPVLLIMGGIVTIKEQWAPLLASVQRLGMAGVVTEMPGVGENTARYDAESWRMLSAVLDAIGDGANVAQTYAIALSFSGHMALRCAVDDPRIKGIITVGAPISEFFTDVGWQSHLPRITVDTLAHLMGVEPASYIGGLRDWKLTEKHLASLDIPLHYLSSRQDEIIPPGEVRWLKDHVNVLHVLEYDDVHGAPGHVAETQLWTITSLFRMRGIRSPGSIAVNFLANMQRARALIRRKTR